MATGFDLSIRMHLELEVTNVDAPENENRRVQARGQEVPPSAEQEVTEMTKLVFFWPIIFRLCKVVLIPQLFVLELKPGLVVHTVVV